MMISIDDYIKPEIILFGGSFDPPHLGHVLCLRKLSAEFPQSKIIVVPSYLPFMHLGKLKAPLFSFEERVAFCRRAFFNIKNLEVSRLESQLPVPSYFINTVNYFSTKNAGKRLAVALGADQLVSFSEWYKPLSILSRADVIVLNRDNEISPRFSEGLESSLACLSKKFGAAVMWNKTRNQATLLSNNGERYKFYLIKDIHSDRSSTELRALIKEGRLNTAGLVKMFAENGERNGA